LFTYPKRYLQFVKGINNWLILICQVQVGLTDGWLQKPGSVAGLRQGQIPVQNIGKGCHPLRIQITGNQFIPILLSDLPGSA